jgi:hypothetical protein
MNRTTILAVTLIISLALSGCIETGDELPDDFEEYESEYISMDLPEDWVIREQRMISPGEFYLECYPSERNKNPVIELHIWNSSVESLDDFVKEQHVGERPGNVMDCRIADRTGKKVVRQDGENEYTVFYFRIGGERYGREMRYYYGKLSFSRNISGFDDADWDMFVNRIVRSLEFED